MHYSPFPGQCGRPQTQAAFTLIELLAVMAIILILAGLILNIAGNANFKAASSRAQGEIQAMAAAMENYKADNGAYPRVIAANATGTCYTTDTLNPQTATDPNGSTPSYASTSQTLYQLLSGAYTMNSTGSTTLATGTPLPTAYYTFTDAQLQNSGGITSGYINPSTVTAILDPFGNSYGYSTIRQADLDAIAQNYPPGQPAPSPYPTPPTTDGFNTSYDLWSTAGYSPKAGKNYPSKLTTAQYNTLWIKNW